MNGSPGGFGLLLEALEELEDLFFVVSSVKDVSGLDDYEFPADPPVVSIDGSSQTQGRSRRGKIAMKVPDGDDALRVPNGG